MPPATLTIDDVDSAMSEVDRLFASDATNGTMIIVEEYPRRGMIYTVATSMRDEELDLAVIRAIETRDWLASLRPGRVEYRTTLPRGCARRPDRPWPRSYPPPKHSFYQGEWT